MGFDIQQWLEKERRYGNSRPVPKSEDGRVLVQLKVPGLQLHMRNPEPEHVAALNEIRAKFPWAFEVNPPKHVNPKLTALSVLKKGEQEVCQEVAIGPATLLLIARGELDVHVYRFKKKVRKQASELLELGDIGADMLDAIARINGLAGDPCLFGAYARWLKRSLAGEESVIYSLVCPDYSHADGRYTFDELWDGVGLVALRAMDGLVPLVDFVHRHKELAGARIVVAMADFEADSELVRGHLGISHEEFVDQCRRSQQALASEIMRRFPHVKDRIQTPLFTEHIGRKQWDAYRAQAQCHVDSGRFTGAFPLDERGMRFITDRRASLFERWMPEVEPRQALLIQSVEYGAVGTATMDNGVNGMLLAADSVLMGPFMHMGSSRVRPTVHMRDAGY